MSKAGKLKNQLRDGQRVDRVVVVTARCAAEWEIEFEEMAVKYESVFDCSATDEPITGVCPHPKRFVMVVPRFGKLAAFAVWQPDKNKAAVYVRPDYRGQGIGRQLTAWALSNGFDPNKALYTKAGFALAQSLCRSVVAA